MRYQIVLDQNELEQNDASTRQAAQNKLTTGEYRQMLHQQYERLAQHQQIIEAEWQAEVTC
jgi:hypothetical protein